MGEDLDIFCHEKKMGARTLTVARSLIPPALTITSRRHYQLYLEIYPSHLGTSRHTRTTSLLATDSRHAWKLVKPHGLRCSSRGQQRPVIVTVQKPEHEVKVDTYQAATTTDVRHASWTTYVISIPTTRTWKWVQDRTRSDSHKTGYEILGCMDSV